MRRKLFKIKNVLVVNFVITYYFTFGSWKHRMYNVLFYDKKHKQSRVT